MAEPNLLVVIALSGLALVSGFLLYRLYAVFTNMETKMRLVEERVKQTDFVLKEIRARTQKMRQDAKPKADFKHVEKRLNDVTAEVLAKEKVREKNG